MIDIKFLGTKSHMRYAVRRLVVVAQESCACNIRI
jgi:hypothetical protein